MNTTCPNCQTEFSIPDHVYKPGRKARCAVCSQVFALPEVPGFVPQVVPAQVVRPAPQPVAQPIPPEPQPAQRAAPQRVEPAPAQLKAVQYAQEPAQTTQPQVAYYTQQPEAESALEPEQPNHAPAGGGEPTGEFAQAVPEDSGHGPGAPWTPGAEPETTPAGDAEAFDQSPPQGGGVNLDWTDNRGVQNMSDTFGATISQGNRQSSTSFDEELDAILGRDSRPTVTGAAEEKQSRPDAATPVKKSLVKKLFLFFGFLLCFAVLGLGGYMIYKSFISGGKKDEQQKVVSIEASELEKVRLLDLKSSGVEYYFVRNEKLGSLLVLEGKVVNNFPTPKSHIEVEARLLNSKGVVIKSQRQICGVRLSQLQLSVLGQQELAKALNDRMQVMTYNVNVTPGAEVPFMVVIVYPPQTAVEFEVTVVDASDSVEPPAGIN